MPRVASSREGVAPSAEAQLRSFIARLEPKQQRLVRSVRSALRKRFPTANELAYDYSRFHVIAYSPTKRGIDAFISFAARPDRLDLYFNHGPKLPDLKKLLKGSGRQTRFITVDSVRQLSLPEVKGFIAGALELAAVKLPSKGKGRLIIKQRRKK